MTGTGALPVSLSIAASDFLFRGVNYSLFDRSLNYFTQRRPITATWGNVALNQKGHLMSKVTEIALQSGYSHKA